MKRRVSPRGALQIPAVRPVLGSLASAGVAQVALVVTGVASARALGPTDRGYLALVILVPTVLHVVGSLGLPRAVTYFIANDPASERSVLRAVRLPGIAQAVALTVLQAVILWLLVADDPPQVGWSALVVLPLAAAHLADMYGKAILQGQHRYSAFNTLRNTAIVLYMVGVLIAVAIGRAGLIEFTFAYVLANLVATVLTLTIAVGMRERPAYPTSAVSRGRLIRFGLRGYVVTLSPIGTFRLDQVVIGLLLPPSALGLYVVGLAFTNLPTFISRSIGLIAFPHVAGAMDRRSEEMRQIFWFSIALTGTAVIVLEVVAGWLVPLFFGSEFESAVVLTRILLLGAFFEGARRVLTDISSGTGRPGIGSLAELSSWLVLVPAVAVLMPAWEEEGVAVATTLSAVASLLVLVALMHHSRRRVSAQRRGLQPSLSVDQGE